jgi:ATP-dependent Zn protease
MVSELGMDTQFGLLAAPGGRGEGWGDQVSALVAAGAKRIVQDQMERALGLLERERQSLDRLTAQLLEANRLTRQDLERILPPLPGVPSPGSDGGMA